MKSLRILFSLTMVVSLLASTMFVQNTQALSGSEFQPGRIIDDSKFFVSSPTMGIADIQNFLNSKVPACDTNGTQQHWSGQTRAQYAASIGEYPPFTCLRDYRDNVSAKTGVVDLCNSMAPGSGTAAEIIYWVSDACGINSQVLLVLLQKEQSLVTDDWPWTRQYRTATGYGCPDTAACDSQYYGFFNQVWNAARQFKLYAKYPNDYGHRAGYNNNVRFNPQASCGTSSVYIENQATAGLYNYTPYQPNAAALANLYGTGDSCSAYGNRNFWRIYNDWFGSTLGPVDYSCVPNGLNIGGAGTGTKVMSNQLGPGPDPFTVAQLNNTGTGCIEAHTWTTNLQGWLQHKATNRPSINPANADVITTDSNGNGFDELVLVEYRETGSGKIEFHLWDSTYQKWKAHVASNRAEIDPAASDIISADLDGNGQDEVLLVQYQGTGSGKIEVHGWTHDYKGWFLHAATNAPAVSKASNRVIAADFDGNGRDELLLVNYTGTSSGKIEVHGWTPDLNGWFLHTATNHATMNPGNGLVTPGNINGVGRDELYMVRYQNTGSGGIEIHGWNYDLQGWFLHRAVAQ